MSKHKCEYCLRHFPSPTELGHHVRIHTGEPFLGKCPKCNFNARTPRGLEKHREEAHDFDPAAESLEDEESQSENDFDLERSGEQDQDDVDSIGLLSLFGITVEDLLQGLDEDLLQDPTDPLNIPQPPDMSLRNVFDDLMGNPDENPIWVKQESPQNFGVVFAGDPDAVAASVQNSAQDFNVNSLGILLKAQQVHGDKLFKYDQCSFSSKLGQSPNRHNPGPKSKVRGLTVAAMKVTQLPSSLASVTGRGSISSSTAKGPLKIPTRNCSSFQGSSKIRKDAVTKHFSLKSSTHQLPSTPRKIQMIKALPLKKQISTGENKKWFKCRFCPHETQKFGLLVSHEMVHTFPHKCRFCLFETLSKSVISHHERAHAGGQPYKCKYCPFKSARKCSLNSHEKGHTGDNGTGHLSAGSASSAERLVATFGDVEIVLIPDQ